MVLSGAVTILVLTEVYHQAEILFGRVGSMSQIKGWTNV